MMIKCLALCVLILGLSVSPVFAEKNMSVDAQFDKTGDGWMDEADWPLLSKEEKVAYARASITSMNANPDDSIGKGETRASQYLQGLTAVYDP